MLARVLLLSSFLLVASFQCQNVVASDTPVARGAAVSVVEDYGNLQLVFDPVLSYSTYLGGGGRESNGSIAVDAWGNAYVTGCTESIDFPTRKALQPENRGGDMFVSKINASGTALVYSTYLGGNGGECGAGIAVDKAGNAYVVGNTGSVTKVNANGSRLVYSTYVDAWNVDDIAVDQAGNAYVTGSGWFDSPPINGTALCLGYCMFVTKINASGTAPLYSTYFSFWKNLEWVSGITVDQAGNAYVAGSTDDGENIDGFVVKIDPSGSSLVYDGSIVAWSESCCTEVWTSDIAVDANGNAYVTGYADPHCVAGMYCEPMRSTDAWMTKIDAGTTGSFEVGTGTSIGGSGDDWAKGIAVDAVGDVYVTGYTLSSNFPTVNALQRYRAGGMDAFVTKINADGSGFAYSTYLGGRTDDLGQGIAVTPIGNAYVIGETNSVGFNKSPVVYQAAPGGGVDAFVTKIASRTFASVTPSTVGFGQPLVGSTSAAKKITVMNNAANALTIKRIHFEGVNAADFVEVNTCPASLAAGATCDVWVTFKPRAKGVRKGFLVINDSDPASPHAVALSGTGTVVSLSPKALSFGSQAVGTTSAAKTTILTNTGSAVLNVSGISLTGINPGDFVLASDCATSIAGGASCKINVTFKPTATGSRSATINISDDGGGNPHKVTLAGTGS